MLSPHAHGLFDGSTVSYSGRAREVSHKLLFKRYNISCGQDPGQGDGSVKRISDIVVLGVDFAISDGLKYDIQV